MVTSLEHPTLDVCVMNPLYPFVVDLSIVIRKGAEFIQDVKLKGRVNLILFLNLI